MNNTNWQDLDDYLTKQNIQSYGTHRAQKALEIILGDAWIENAVEEAIGYKGGANELALNCLSHLSSLKAAQYAYKIYKASDDTERRSMAVWLIKHMRVKESFEWIEEFIRDASVKVWGVAALDQLLWCNVIDYEVHKERVDELLAIALTNADENLAENIAFIKSYLENNQR